MKKFIIFIFCLLLSSPVYAANMRTAVVKNTTPTTTGTLDFTSSGFGTPDAAIFYMSYASTDGSPQSRKLLYSEGYTDGTSEAGIGIFSQHNVGTSDTARRYIGNGVLLETNSVGSASNKFGAFNAWITDGVRIDWTVSSGSEQFIVTCVLIKGVSAKVGILQINSTVNSDASYTGTSFTPDIVLASGIGYNVSPNAGGIHNIFSSGIAVNDGSETQRGYLLSDVDNVDTSVTSHRLETDACCGQLHNNSLTWSGELTAFNADGFTITSRDAGSGGDYIIFLCLASDSDVSLHTLSSPTSAGTNKITTTFQTEGAIGTFSSLTSIDTVNTTDVNFCSFSADNGGNEYSVGVGSEDGVGTTNTYDIVDAKIINCQYFNSGTPSDLVIANVDSWDSDGLTLNYTTVDGSARKGFVLLWGEAAAAPTFTPKIIFF